MSSPGLHHRISAQAPAGCARRDGDQQTIRLDVNVLRTRDWLFTVKDGLLTRKVTMDVDCEEAIGACRSLA